MNTAEYLISSKIKKKIIIFLKVFNEIGNEDGQKKKTWFRRIKFLCFLFRFFYLIFFLFLIILYILVISSKIKSKFLFQKYFKKKLQ